jgi:pimeloyl-ACP methyl ester carboxylesterase
MTATVAQPRGSDRPMAQPTVYRTTPIDGLSIFYREAGPKDGPTLLLLHGLPSSSRMFEPLFARLADRYHLVAPDYPGFGHSDWPDPKAFAYTFDHYAEIMNHFTEALGLSRYTLYMQDYGGPVGFRMALAHPERVEKKLAAQPAITVPAVTLDGLADGNFPATDGSTSARHFTGPRVHHQVPNAGHNLPQEAPDAFASAVLEVAHLRSPSGGV